MTIFWNVTGAMAFAVIVIVLARFFRREYRRDVLELRRQANCVHPYTYLFSGKRLCASCGKPQPRKPREEGVI